jgi:putative transposase
MSRSPLRGRSEGLRQGTASAVPKRTKKEGGFSRWGTMAIPSRHGGVVGTYFVTSRTWQSRQIFKTPPACQIFIEFLFRYRDQGAYGLHAFVLMPDHFHILITPGQNTTLERAVQFVKGGSSKAIRERLLFSFPVWQRGFSDHRIRHAADYDSHLSYLEQNPVRKTLSETASEFPWSSASRKYPVDKPPQGLKPLGTGATNGTAEAVPGRRPSCAAQ